MKLWVLLAALLVVSPVFADLTANATISPRYVDTSVANQTFIYTITPFNESLVNRTIITIPSGYTVMSIVNVTIKGESCTVALTCTGAIETGNVTINFTNVAVNSSQSPVVITLAVNTSASAIIGNFTSYLNNSLFRNQTTDAGINVTTQQMIVANVSMTKGTAILNGTDYWEFKFTLGLTTAQNGLVQFRMNNWTDVNGNTLGIFSGSTYYAALRGEQTPFSNITFNVSNTYRDAVTGINKSTIALTDFYLKMILPVGSAVSDSWSSSYSILFRSTP